MPRDLRLRLNREELCRLYFEEKRSLEDIARIYGVSRVAVWKYCKDENLNRRSRSKARLEAQKKGKVPQDYFEINELFFSKWTGEMAYVLGLIATDGCISKSGTVSLCINDRELLEKVKQVMGAEHNIKSCNRQPNLYQFHFARERLVADLSKLSSSKSFIIPLELKLVELGLPKRNIYQTKTKNAISYMFRYGHADSIKLYKIMYENMQQSGLFLQRKHNKFLAGLKGLNNG